MAVAYGTMGSSSQLAAARGRGSRQGAARRMWRASACMALTLTGLMGATFTSPSFGVPTCDGEQGAVCGQPATLANGIAFGYDPVRQVSASAASAAIAATANTGAKATTHAAAAPGRAVHTQQTVSPVRGDSSLAPVTGGQPCQDRTMFVARITQWTVPPGCYGTIYTPDQSAYRTQSRFGYCNWWVEALHPNQQDILYGKEYTRGSTPVPGAAMWFDPGVQGASPAGHWAQVVAIAPGGYWLLITEMNFGWRGGGFGKVDYRYAHVGPGVAFVY